MKAIARAGALLATVAWICPVADAQGVPSRKAAAVQLERGTTAFRAGDMAAALRAWSEALRLARELRASDIEAQALARRGEMYRTQGYLRDARDDLGGALVKAEAVGDAALIARVSGALGNLEMTPHRHADGQPAQRRLDLAEPLLLRSRELAAQAGDLVTLAASYNDLGNLYAQTGRPIEAASAYSEAIRGATQAGDQTLAAGAEVNAARLALQRAESANAQQILRRAIDRLEALPPSYSSGMTLLSAGSAALERVDSAPEYRSQAERAFRAAARAADTLQNPALSSLARGNLARLSKPNGDAGDRTRLTDQALFAAQNAAAPELSFRWEWQKARQALQQGTGEEALAGYRRAVAALQSVRRDIPVDYHDGRSSYRTTFGPLYLEFADLLLRRAASERGRAQSLIREARDTVEQLKESELQDYFRDSCITSFKERRQPIGTTVPPGVAVLYPISLPDRLELLVGFGTEQRQFSVPVGEAALRSQVQKFRELLEKRTTNEYLVPAWRLYEQIIRPIEPLLTQQGLNTIVVVPDNVLRIVPFAALHDGKHFLVERYATAIAPSMDLIDARPPDAGEQPALILGLSKSVQGYAELPNVVHEAAAVQRLRGGKQLLDEAFTERRFASELKDVPYDIVHIASHGRFSSDPKQSFVLAFDGKLSMDKLETDVKSGARRQSALELLMLSACETATGDDRAALGLAGIALKAGARSAVASLWHINDEAAGELVVDFYRMLRFEGTSKALALQAAQRKMAATQRYDHPAYWAPFLLIGNWR